MLYDCRKATFSLYVNDTSGYAVWDTHITGCLQEQKLRTGSWHHLAVTFNAAKNTAKIYRDNVLQETDSNVSWANNASNMTSLLIGSSFTGRMDDIAIFNTELDAAEISSLYNTEPCCTVL
jgi:hypothetical protein